MAQAHSTPRGSAEKESPMTPAQVILEETAEFVREILNTHWTVVLIPLFGAALFFAGLLAGRGRS